MPRGALLISHFPTVLDIGGQESKAIALLENGKVRKCKINDRCAARRGRFLVIIPGTLGFEIEDFGRVALSAEKEDTLLFGSIIKLLIRG